MIRINFHIYKSHLESLKMPILYIEAKVTDWICWAEVISVNSTKKYVFGTRCVIVIIIVIFHIFTLIKSELVWISDDR